MSRGTRVTARIAAGLGAGLAVAAGVLTTVPGDGADGVQINAVPRDREL